MYWSREEMFAKTEKELYNRENFVRNIEELFTITSLIAPVEYCDLFLDRWNLFCARY